MPDPLEAIRADQEVRLRDLRHPVELSTEELSRTVAAFNDWFHETQELLNRVLDPTKQLNDQLQAAHDQLKSPFEEITRQMDAMNRLMGTFDAVQGLEDRLKRLDRSIDRTASRFTRKIG